MVSGNFVRLVSSGVGRKYLFKSDFLKKIQKWKSLSSNDAAAREPLKRANNAPGGSLR
jgi:hypothetical protein